MEQSDENYGRISTSAVPSGTQEVFKPPFGLVEPQCLLHDAVALGHDWRGRDELELSGAILSALTGLPLPPEGHPLRSLAEAQEKRARRQARNAQHR